MARITKAVQSLAEMKGAPMKLGQMLSLQEGMFPPEVQQVFALLQKNAPPLPGREMRAIVESECGTRAAEIDSFSEEPMAAASLGQVHRARLKDGRDIVFKILYPGARKSLSTDLVVLRSVLMLFSPMTAVPVRKILREVKERLLEEIDYRKEKANLMEARRLYNYPWLEIPAVIEDLSTDRVLAMEYVHGAPLREALAMPDEIRTLFARHILTLVVEGILEHRFLHADPNAGNLAFLPDGRLVLYDFGCMKRVPSEISENYRRAARHLFRGEFREVPQCLFQAGIQHQSGRPLEFDFLRPYMEFYTELIPDRESTFGELTDVYNRMWDMGRGDFLETRNIVFPTDVMFVHRTLLGHFGNLRTLKARGNWRQFLQSLLS